MPNLYTVQLNVNVPGLGNRNVVQNDIQAADITTAVAQVVANVKIEVLKVEKTGAVP